MKPEILFEDSEILVCHKPAGMAVQTASFSSQDMVSLLKNHLMREARKSGTPLKGAPYLAVIHRLDQPVEGILVFGKTKKAAAALNTQLTGDGFGKYYEAVTEGAPTESSGTLTDWLVRDGRTNLSSVCSPDTPDAKKACQKGRPGLPDAGSAYPGRAAHFPSVHSSAHGTASPDPCPACPCRLSDSGGPQIQSGRHSFPQTPSLRLPP